MCYKLSIKVEADINLSDDEFALLWKSCTSHYDSSIRFLLMPGQFMYGWKNLRISVSDEADKSYTLKFREIDKLCKSLEMDINNSQLSYQLFKKLSRILEDINETSVVLNKLI